MKPKPQLEWRQQAMDDLVAIVEYIAEDRDRKVLVLTERTEHLDAIHVCSARTNIGRARRTQVTSDLTAI